MIPMRQIIDIIKNSRQFLITAHVRLDGDAVGSELALYHALCSMGKKAVVYNQDIVPWNYRFLPGCEVIVHNLPPVDQYDCVFILDCSELDRIGDGAEKIRAARRVINIDHHLSNGGFTELRLIDARASSTGELLYRLFDEMGIAMTKEVATNLYAAILTDTGGFRYASTHKETLIAAGMLLGAGADPQWISENIYENNPLARLRLLAIVLGTLRLELDDMIGSLVVSRQALEEAGATHEHTEGLVDYPRSIQSVVISVLYTQTEESMYKVSLRSKEQWNVERVARAFGGGGHLNAAACRIEGDLPDVRHRLMEKIASVVGKQ
jgi:bifunctional oligoribonuclease and PAP phosphatase NrnA